MILVQATLWSWGNPLPLPPPSPCQGADTWKPSADDTPAAGVTRISLKGQLSSSSLSIATFRFTCLYIFIPHTCRVFILTYHSSYPGGKTWQRLSCHGPLWWARIRVLRSMSPKALVKFLLFPRGGLLLSCELVVLWRTLGRGGGEGGNEGCIMCMWSPLLFQVLITSLYWCLKLRILVRLCWFLLAGSDESW